MKLYAIDPDLGHKLQTDLPGLKVDRAFIAHYQLAAADAVAASTTAIKAATTLADGLTTTLTTADITQPTTPRVPSITGNAATAVGNVVFTGTDWAGETITETIVSTGAATVLGTKAFAHFETIVLPARGAVADTIALGISDKFGLPYKLPHDTVLKVVNDGTATTVAASSFSATELCKNHLDLAAALNGKVVDIYLMV
jgi:hypothetical protein